MYQRVLLEGEPKSELNLACGGFGGHPAGAGGYNVPIRCVEDGVVEGVEHVDSEVDELLFAELKHLVQRDVEQGYPIVPQWVRCRVVQRLPRRLVAEGFPVSLSGSQHSERSSVLETQQSAKKWPPEECVRNWSCRPVDLRAWHKKWAIRIRKSSVDANSIS